MYRIMLVDDEPGVRNSIKAKMDWEAAGFRIEWEAENGLEALELMERGAAPDLVITDIRMPKMDGVAFVKVCKEKHPSLRVIVLSGYSDFEYTKAAIQLGVRDYLLKPVVRQELLALLQAVAGELQSDREELRQRRQEELRTGQMLRVMQEQAIWQLVKEEGSHHSAVRERLRQLQMEELADGGFQARFAVAEMRIPSGRLEEEGGRKDLLHLAFQLLCRESAEKRGRIYPLYDVNHPAMMYFLILAEKESSAAAADMSEDFIRGILRDMKRYLRVDGVVGLGETVQGLGRLKDGYASCMLSWSRNTVHNGSAGSRSGLKELTRVFTPEVERKLVQAVENADLKAFEKQLELIYGTETPMFVFTFLTLRIMLLFSGIAKKFELEDTSLQNYLWECQTAVRDYQSRPQVVGQLRAMAEKVMEEVRRTRFSSGQQMMAAIRKYVDENYSYELTLSSLAERFHLNETYLSGLFKQSTGETFSDYVTRLRLEKAAALLKENELRLTDIAILVGYSSPSYFSTAFKKGYGVSPKEFREQALRE